jgi:hypothetical protein
VAELTREQLEKARETVLKAKSDARHMMFAGPLMEAMLDQFDADTRRFKEMEWKGHVFVWDSKQMVDHFGCQFCKVVAANDACWPKQQHAADCPLAARIALGEVDHG